MTETTITIHVDDLDQLQQLALLPYFEGRRPSSAQVRLTGTTDTPCRTLHIGDDVILVVRAAVTKVTHEQQDSDGGPLARVHGLKVAEAHVLPDDAGAEMLEVAEKLSRAIDDARNGRIPLPAV